jgi:hypothetical protein
MRSEARRIYSDGFFLSEQELRRLYDIAIQQMKKTILSESIKSEIEVKFRNGVISNPEKLDDVFTLENEGSASIEEISMDLFDKEEKPNYRVLVSFSNPLTQYNSESIRYYIVGNERDWVFITSSLIEERISKIKRFTTRRFMGKSLGRYVSNAYTTIASLFFIVLVFTFFVFQAAPRSETLESIEADWRSGRLTDPLEALIRLEKRATFSGINATGQAFLFATFILSVLVAVLIPLLAFFYPPYVFYWSDGMKRVDRRRSIGNFILIVVILGIVLSVISNFVYDVIR